MLVENAPAEPQVPARLRVSTTQRPRVNGKFFYIGDEKLYVRGVTYGTFRAGADGHEFPCIQTVDRDFAHMAALGFNAVRTYTVPPPAVLDLAQRHGLHLMVGLSGERSVGFYAEGRRIQQIAATVAAGARACKGHPAILCYSVANEIPSRIARWLGRRRVEDYVRGLYDAVKTEDPGALATYVNYPSTEYLRLPFLDFACFNVYLESPDGFRAYLARLQNLAGDRPLLMSELGLDSLRNGEETQAHVLDWQVRTTFAEGCAGAFVFAWTDEWHAGGVDMDDWAFGLTARDRSPKPALAAVREAFAEVPLVIGESGPRVSVVVCSYNGSRTIRETCERLMLLDYPDYEVIVVDDGSTDDTADVARDFGYRVITTANAGLSSARNEGLRAATGDIVVYLDDDAYPDPHWLTYLVSTFATTDFVCVGGPNIPPPGDGIVADCVANAPGGPVHVLLSDREAEHVPGCNMAFRTEALRAIGGFDPQFRSAGDDVDVCWRLQERGWRLGFNPAAVVWHHRRNAVKGYWRQQLGYGRAEALLERKWPEKYNSAGHLAWAGRIYGTGWTSVLGLAERIYHGPWGSAPFQSLYQPTASMLHALPLMPEWYLLVVALAALSALGAVWTPLLLAVPILVAAVGASLALAAVATAKASFPASPRSTSARLKRRLLTFVLHLLQPLARLRGRIDFGLTPWRRRATARAVSPWPRLYRLWSERGQEQEVRLQRVADTLVRERARVLHGGAFDRWDLELRGGIFGAARLLMGVEELGAGSQMVRVRCWSRCLPRGVIATALFGTLACAAAFDHAWPAAIVLGGVAGMVAVRIFQECSAALGAILSAVEQSSHDQRS